MILKIYDNETNELITEIKVRKNASFETRIDKVKNYFKEKYELSFIRLLIQGSISALYGNDLHYLILSDKLNKSIVIQGL
jgi:hypothetical protein